jgi:hypothetical protein
MLISKQHSVSFSLCYVLIKTSDHIFMILLVSFSKVLVGIEIKEGIIISTKFFIGNQNYKNMHDQLLSTLLVYK